MRFLVRWCEGRCFFRHKKINPAGLYEPAGFLYELGEADVNLCDLRLKCLKKSTYDVCLLC